MELSDSNQKLENRVDELDRKCRNQQEQVLEMKERLTLAQSENKLQTTQHGGAHLLHHASRLHGCISTYT